MEKLQIKKAVIAIIILAALAAAGFAISYVVSDGEPGGLEGVIEGDFTSTPSKVDEGTAEEVRAELAAPAETVTNKEDIRKELSQPAPGGLSEEEKERIRAELRK